MILQNYFNQLEKYYSDYLCNTIGDVPFETIELRGGKKIPERTSDLHKAVEQFQKHEKRIVGKGWTIKWDTINSKRLNVQEWPTEIIVTTEEDYLHLINKKSEVFKFKKILDKLVSWKPQIRGWLLNQYKVIFKFADKWNSICPVVDFLLQNDVSNYYIRSLPVPVHTKFLEEHSNLLLALLQYLDPNRFPKELKNLEDALQLKRKPYLFKLRWLDKELAARYSHGMEIIGVTTENLRFVTWPVQEVWFVENETNLYLLPERRNTLAIFSSGKAVSLLSAIPLFNDSTIRYWGDLDVAGFHILHQLRKHYKHVKSMLMDYITVNAHQAEMKHIDATPRHPELKLHQHEEEAYQLIQPTGRIEQEKLNQEFVQKYFTSML